MKVKALKAYLKKLQPDDDVIAIVFNFDEYLLELGHWCREEGVTIDKELISRVKKQWVSLAKATEQDDRVREAISGSMAYDFNQLITEVETEQEANKQDEQLWKE